MNLFANDDNCLSCRFIADEQITPSVDEAAVVFYGVRMLNEYAKSNDTRYDKYFHII